MDIDKISKIKDLYFHHKQSSSSEEVTEKQLKLIESLGGSREELSKERSISGYISRLKRERKLSPTEIIELLAKYNEDDIRYLLGKEINILTLTVGNRMLIDTFYQHPDSFETNIYQHVLISGNNYEYGWQESKKCRDNKMYYLSFTDFMMIDIDDEKDIDRAKEKIKSYGLSARIYQTYNGYHIFITSMRFHHRSEQSFSLMRNLDCDPYYILFSRKLGFRVRLSPKIREGAEETSVSRFLEKIGTKEDPYLLELLEVHDRYILSQ